MGTGLTSRVRRPGRRASARRFRNRHVGRWPSQQTLRNLRERRGNRVSSRPEPHRHDTGDRHDRPVHARDPPAAAADLRALPDPADPRATAEAILFEIRRVIVGQDAMLERVLVGLLSGGHLLLEGVPGLAKTLTIKTLADVLGGSFKRIQFTPDLMPSDLVGTRIYRPDQGRLRGRARPGLRQLPPRRRDQPRPGQGPVRAARGHAGAPGHDRPRDLQGPDPVPRPGHREPDRGRGHLPAARGPGRPVHAQDPARLPEPGRRGADRRPLAGRRRPQPREILDAAGLLRLQQSGRPRSTSTRGSSATRSRSSRPPASSPTGARPSSRPTSPTAPARAARSTSSTAPGRWPCSTAAATSCPSDIVALAPDVLRHRLVMSYAALADGRHPRHASSTASSRSSRPRASRWRWSRPHDGRRRPRTGRRADADRGPTRARPDRRPARPPARAHASTAASVAR